MDDNPFTYLSVPKPRDEDCDARYLKEMQLNPVRRPGGKNSKKKKTVLSKQHHVKTVSPCANRWDSYYLLLICLTSLIRLTVITHLLFTHTMDT